MLSPEEKDGPDSSGPYSSDHAQFLMCFARDHQRILSYIFSLLHNRADAEDVFQQTSLTLWQKFGDYDRERDFFPWACGVAFYTVRNFLRVSGRNPLRFSDDLLKTIADERVVADGRLSHYGELLEECLQRLNRADQSLVRQAYSGETTIKELADSLGRAVQTVYNRLNAIRHKLGDCVDRKIALQ